MQQRFYLFIFTLLGLIGGVVGDFVGGVGRFIGWLPCCRWVDGCVHALLLCGGC